MPDNHRMPLTLVHANFVQFPSGNDDRLALALDSSIGRFARVAAFNARHFRLQNRVDLQERFASDVQQRVPERGNSTPNSGKVKSTKVQKIVRIARGPVQNGALAANSRSQSLVTA